MHRRRGQMALIGLAAVALVVLVVTYIMLSGRSVEHRAAIKEGELEDLVSEFDNEQRYMEKVLSEAINGAISEMVSHGGYTEESLPKLNRHGVPFFFYKGNIVNIPTLNLMNQMLAQEVERRVNSQLDRHREEVKGRRDQYEIGYPSIKANLSEEFAIAGMTIPVSVMREGDKVRSTMNFEKILPSKLGNFRKLAEAYIVEYEQIRIVEESLISGMIQDDRVWEPPGRMMHSVSCDDPPHKTWYDLYSPIQENAEVAVALEQVRLRAVYGRSNLQWGLGFNVADVEMAIVANIGNLDWSGRDWSTDSYPDKVFLVPQKFPPMSASTDICYSVYTCAYDITFPILVTAMDLTPTGRLVSSEGQDVSQTPEFRFYIQPYLGHYDDGRPNKFAVDESVGEFQFRDNQCMGSCSIGLKLDGTKEGQIWLDDCNYNYPMGQVSDLDFVKDGIACGLRTLVIESNDPVKARVVERINIHEGFKATYVIPDFATVAGTVKENYRVHCTGTSRTKDEVRPLKETGGGLFVDLVPLEPRLGSVVTQPVDDDGTYRFENVNPGNYIIIARPLVDKSGSPAYALEPEAVVQKVNELDNEGIDVTMEPLNIVRVGTAWRRVSDVQEC
ncbi:MAG: hypothetical protein QF415_04835 [Candidatus Undinarchaeales archaeon]|nr:hypothetical protein [Candidatus Undinarchaeales archaeon]MDP7493136.1 hypothetical protein [Candidatus Undinarchaeales archaeon]